MTRIRTTPRLVAGALGAFGVLAALALWTGSTLVSAALPDPAPAPTATPGPMYTIAGRVVLPAAEATVNGGTCTSLRSDIHPGALVLVTDATGAMIAHAPLMATTVDGDGCVLPFSLLVPVGAGLYGIDVGSYGQLLYSEAELRDLDGLTIS